MDRYVCSICGYVYDPEQGDPDNGVAAGTKWELTLKKSSPLSVT
jgi:rubredoxin